MSTINPNQLANVVPGVLAVGGTGRDILGLLLSTSSRVPIGTVAEFDDDTSVGDYFGLNSPEFAFAEIYFTGFEGKNKIPDSMFVAQYNQVAVGAYLRGGNITGLTIAQLQAISGSLNVVIDGYPRNAASVNLSGAASFSAAAATIQTALNAADPNEAMFTAAIGAAFTASAGSPTTKLVVTSVTGVLSVGDTPIGAGIPGGAKIISQDAGGTPGGAGTYVLSVANTASAASCTSTSNVLVVSAVSSGALAVGQNVQGAGFTDAVITALGTGTGQAGTYIVSGAQQHVASESMTSEGTPVAVTFDSVSGGFIVASGITGSPSTAAFATGTIAASLLLTLATGAVVSQGAAAASPAAFMNALVQVNALWTTFTTLFDPDNDSGNTAKQAFAAWKNTQSNRFAYVCWDTDQSPLAAVPASASLGQVLMANGDSGTFLLDGDTTIGWADATAPSYAAFVMGTAASIDFDEERGRTTFAYRSQAGLQGMVSTNPAALNLGGNPQVNGSDGNGYNFYGAYGTAGANAVATTWLQRGTVTGAFKWFDSFVNQVWLNSFFQQLALAYFGATKSTPYNNTGYSALEQMLMPAINAGLLFGAFAPGTISAQQIAELKAAAGTDISQTLQTQGWYLQITTASDATRAGRTSPPSTFWYLDRGSIQALNLSSILVQ